MMKTFKRIITRCQTRLKNKFNFFRETLENLSLEDTRDAVYDYGESDEYCDESDECFDESDKHSDESDEYSD